VIREFITGTGRSAADPHGVVADHLHRHIAEIPGVQVTAAALGFGECIGTGEGAVGVDRPGLRIDDEHDVGVAAVEGLGAVEALGSLGSGAGAVDARGVGCASNAVAVVSVEHGGFPLRSGCAAFCPLRRAPAQLRDRTSR